MRRVVGIVDEHVVVVVTREDGLLRGGRARRRVANFRAAALEQHRVRRGVDAHRGEIRRRIERDEIAVRIAREERRRQRENDEPELVRVAVRVEFVHFAVLVVVDAVGVAAIEEHARLAVEVERVGQAVEVVVETVLGEIAVRGHRQPHRVAQAVVVVVHVVPEMQLLGGQRAVEHAGGVRRREADVVAAGRDPAVDGVGQRVQIVRVRQPGGQEARDQLLDRREPAKRRVGGVGDVHRRDEGLAALGGIVHRRRAG